MNLKKLMFFISLFTIGSMAQANFAHLACKGSKDLFDYELAFYRGSNNQEFYVLITSSDGHSEMKSGQAKGGSFVGCGTRTLPCLMIRSTQYTIDELKLIITMSAKVSAKELISQVSVYKDGFGLPSTLDFTMTCKKP